MPPVFAVVKTWRQPWHTYIKFDTIRYAQSVLNGLLRNNLLLFFRLSTLFSYDIKYISCKEFYTMSDGNQADGRMKWRSYAINWDKSSHTKIWQLQNLRK